MAFSVLGVCIATGLLTIAILMLTHISSSGTTSPLCIPHMSLRCEPDECGSEYVRCGRRQQRQKVPANKVCYQGALVSTSSGIHISRSSLFPGSCSGRGFTDVNSTEAYNLKANCGSYCKLCEATNRCYCTCKYLNDCSCKSMLKQAWWMNIRDLAIKAYLKDMCNFLQDQFTFPPRPEHPDGSTIRSTNPTCCGNNEIVE